MFFFKKIKFLLLIIFFLIFSLVAFIAIDDSSRRSVISKVLVLHDIYRIRSLTHGLQVRDFSLLSKRLNEYIDVSNKFSDDRTYMFPGIYEATELVMSRAITQDDYNKIENVLEKLLKFDDRIYKLHVWYARALSDDNYEKALKHIDIAIEISPSVMSSSPATILSNVVLPQPEGPTSTTNSPSLIFIFTSSKARVPFG